MKNPQRPDYITEENRNKMSRKEKDYIQLLREKRWTKEEIMRKLYITTDMWFWKLRQRVRIFINSVDCNLKK